MIEIKLLKTFPQEIIALDEVGRSPLSGPVVAGALRLRVESEESLLSLLRSLRRLGVKDSKKLTHEKRAKLLKKFGIEEKAFREKSSFVWKEIELSYLTWEMDHRIIEKENIHWASLRAMKEAALGLQLGPPEEVTILMDGNSKFKWQEEAPGWKEISIVKGDEKSPLIGLAAIIAKEKRDAFMREMHLLYPHFGFDTNMGYPTPKHREALRIHGPSPIHRRTFK